MSINPINELQKQLAPFLKKAGKTIGDIKILVASKYLNVAQMKRLYQMGQRDFAENKVQDALLKIPEMPNDVRWHFIGHLQKNKVNKIVDLFDYIHSIDSIELALKIAERSARPQKLFLQVNPLNEASKRGFSLDDFAKSLSEIEKMSMIEICGLMAMAPLSPNKDVVRSAFAMTRQLKEKYDKRNWKLSMGMSQDYPLAIEEGADIIRIGRYFLPRV